MGNETIKRQTIIILHYMNNETELNSGFDVYQLFMALRLHFTSDTYNFFQYHGKTRVSQRAFLADKSKYSFYKFSRKYSVKEARDFFVSNLIVMDNKRWIGDFVSEEAESNYREWMKRNQSLEYVFKSDIDYLFDNLTCPGVFWTVDQILLGCDDGQYPILLKKVIGNDICIETICILNGLMNFLPMWKKKIDDDIIFPVWERRILKYTPFIAYDKEISKKIVSNKMKEIDHVAH